MYKKMILILSTVLIALLSVGANASVPINASTPASTGMKIGVINLQEIFQKNPHTAQISADLKKQFSEREQKVIAAQNELKKTGDEYKKNMTVMKEADLKAAQQKLLALQQSLQQMQGSFQTDYMAAQNKAVTSLLQKIKTIVEQVAKQQNYDLVLTTASIAYIDPKYNITDQVMKEMGKAK